MKNAFIPPKLEYPIAWMIDFSFPLFAKFGMNLNGIDISGKDRELLRSLRKERMLYMSNHPSTIEPPIAYYVANIMGTRFHYLAARNVFNWMFGLLGDLISKLGAFSVLTGTTDRETLKTSRSILAEPGGKLVIYPEGMCSMENDNLAPFMPGIAQIGFWGLEDARKNDSQADIVILPAFVKYTLAGSRTSLLQEIESSLRRLEEKLGIEPGNRNLLRQFLAVGRVLLENAEKEYGINASDNDDYDYRVGHVRHAALNRAAQRLQVKLDSGSDSFHKIREVFKVKDAIDSGIEDSKRPKIPPEDFIMGSRDLDTAYTFIVIKPEYLVSRPTPERFMEWIYRFETHVFGATNFRARRARVIFSDPFRIGDYYESYKKDKKKTVDEVTKRLRKDIESLLEQCISMSEPLVAPYDAGDGVKYKNLSRK